MKVTVSVPGKIILMGDHAIVHGAPALLAAINMRMYVTAETHVHQDRERIHISADAPDTYIRKIIEIVTTILKISPIPPLNITVRSEIPVGYHLGSSAATAVAVTGAVMYLLKKIWNPQKINEIAYEAEKFQHGNPSGGDNSAITFGGLLWYRKELEFLKSIWSLPFKPDSKLRQFYLIDTGRPAESTGEMVIELGERVKANEKKYREIFSKNEVQTKRVTRALKEGLEDELIDAIRVGEKTLEDMDVVSEKAKKIIGEIERSGGAAKILGGGGKKAGVGYLLCYHPDSPKLMREMKVLKPREVHLGEEGVRLEEK